MPKQHGLAVAIERPGGVGEVHRLVKDLKLVRAGQAVDEPPQTEPLAVDRGPAGRSVTRIHCSSRLPRDTRDSSIKSPAPHRTILGIVGRIPALRWPRSAPDSSYGAR